MGTKKTTTGISRNGTKATKAHAHLTRRARQAQAQAERAARAQACIGCGERADLSRPEWLMGWPVCGGCCDASLLDALDHAAPDVPVQVDVENLRASLVEAAALVRALNASGELDLGNVGCADLVRLAQGWERQARGSGVVGGRGPALATAAPLPDAGGRPPAPGSHPGMAARASGGRPAACVDCRPERAQDCERCPEGKTPAAADARAVAGLASREDVRDAMGLAAPGGPVNLPEVFARLDLAIEQARELDTPAPTCNLGVAR